MTPKLLEECENYRRHFAELLDIGCRIVAIPENDKTFISPGEDPRDFCTYCTHGKNKGLTTHLYGCNEAHRWGGKYIYYCPLGLTFVAASVPDSSGAAAGGIVIGPIVMGDMEDVLYDIPAQDMQWAVSQLSVFSTKKVRHISEILSAVTAHIADPGDLKRDTILKNKEKLLYEINIARDAYADDDAKSAEVLLNFERDLHFAMLRGEKNSSLHMINEVLAYIHVYSNFDIRSIKARLLELLVILSRATIEAGADPSDTFRLSEDFISQLEQYTDPDQLALWISDIVRRFVQQAFDLAHVKHSDVVFKTISYIKRNCAEKLSLNSLAREVYLSKSYLSSIFKKETGISLTAYITRVRVEKSKKLLLGDNGSLANISNQCGFKDQSYFTKVFKKETGVSPKRFRSDYFNIAESEAQL